MRIYIRHVRRPITAQHSDMADRIGIAAYRITNASERRVLETYLRPNAAHRADRDRD